MVSVIEMYQSSDGKIWKRYDEALRREEQIELAIWYEENKIFGKSEGCRIEFEELDEWLKEHWNKLDAVYGRAK